VGGSAHRRHELDGQRLREEQTAVERTEGVHLSDG
jgi:hypothetical protein